MKKHFIIYTYTKAFCEKQGFDYDAKNYNAEVLTDVSKLEANKRVAELQQIKDGNVYKYTYVQIVSEEKYNELFSFNVK